MNNTLRIALIGGNSKVGSAISRLLEKETDWQLHVYSSTLQQSVSDRIFCKHIEYADIKKLKEEFIEIRPDFIINTAAMTNVDGCEIQRQEAWFSNVTFVEQLARLSLIVESHLIHFSTDYVFDGTKGPYTEQDQPNPICYYGKSKLAGENAVLKSHFNNTVIRTNVVYGLTTNDQSDFVQWVIKCHEAKKTMNIVDDQLSNPTLTDDLALSVKRIIEKKRCGLYHIGGNTYCNRYEFTLEIAKIFHLDESLIAPIQTHSLNQKAKRPLRGGLINLKAHTDLGIQYSTIQEGLVRLRHNMHAFNQE
ncbi:MAG: dTDP-4-dehydrorhamnose reductase [Ignavibacteria bacterium]|nr:dTDP-4-dehydrorhamnose reductase [Ignavibacteria bacterium]